MFLNFAAMKNVVFVLLLNIEVALSTDAVQFTSQEIIEITRRINLNRGNLNPTASNAQPMVRHTRKTCFVAEHSPTFVAFPSYMAVQLSQLAPKFLLCPVWLVLRN
jgi:hypothetical protein